MSIVIGPGIQIGGQILIGGGNSAPVYNYITDASGNVLTGQQPTVLLTQG